MPHRLPPYINGFSVEYEFIIAVFVVVARLFLLSILVFIIVFVILVVAVVVFLGIVFGGWEVVTGHILLLLTFFQVGGWGLLYLLLFQK